MHIHPNQINPNMQLDSLCAAEKAAAKREVERTRKKLLESASKLAGQAESEEDCVVKLGAHDQEPKEQGQKQFKRKSTEQMSPGNTDQSISDWA
jgi:phage terminase large subunit GpA-like protein